MAKKENTQDTNSYISTQLAWGYYTGDENGGGVTKAEMEAARSKSAEYLELYFREEEDTLSYIK